MIRSSGATGYTRNPNSESPIPAHSVSSPTHPLEMRRPPTRRAGASGPNCGTPRIMAPGCARDAVAKAGIIAAGCWPSASSVIAWVKPSAARARKPRRIAAPLPLFCWSASTRSPGASTLGQRLRRAIGAAVDHDDRRPARPHRRPARSAISTGPVLNDGISTAWRHDAPEFGRKYASSRPENAAAGPSTVKRRPSRAR